MDDFGEEHAGEMLPLKKGTKEIAIDWLSHFPDELLIHILSFLGVNQAVVTGALSKRWEYLWAELPELEFREIGRPAEFVCWVNKTLAVRKAKSLEKFLVRFNNRCDVSFSSHIDNWISISVESQVKKLVLIMGFGESYPLPEVVYSCCSVNFLHLYRCSMQFESRIEWKLLTRLILDVVQLNQSLIDEILSGCPALISLELEGCRGFDRLEINSRCVNHLKVYQDEGDEHYVPYLEISAPYVSDLVIAVIPQEGTWKLKNISSLVKASVNFLSVNFQFGDPSEDNAVEFIEKFKQVKELNIGRTCFEVVARMVKNGRQLPHFKLQHLVITCCSDFGYTKSAIICLLDSSPNLETLHLCGLETFEEKYMAILDERNDLDGDLLHLKDIRIENFNDPNGEPLLSLTRILLIRTPALTNMSIKIEGGARGYVTIGKLLMAFPSISNVILDLSYDTDF